MKHTKTLERKVELPDLETFGAYRLGLTNNEIKEYLTLCYNIVTKKKRKECPEKVIKQFNDIAGSNTVAVGPNGESLLYRTDVERFSRKLFLGEETYFD